MKDSDHLNLYVLTFNCARTPIQTDLFAKHLFHALPSSSVNRREESFDDAPELIVLCLQEIAPIAYAFLGGGFLAPYFDAFQKAVDHAVSKRWDTTNSTRYYVNSVRENSGMTGLMVFVRSDVVDRISWIDTAQVGVGIQQMGNKGAVGARLGFLTDHDGELPSGPHNAVHLTFVAAHLAPMEYNVEQRNEDWRAIVERLVFSRKTPARRTSSSNNNREGGSDESAALLLQEEDSTTPVTGMFTPTAYLFFAGDLNYRTSDALSKKGDSAQYPRSIQDETSPLHYAQFLKRDQLSREMRAQKCLHGLSEAPIHFPPTYKYSTAARLAAFDTSREDGELDEWKWASYRWPSWTDRILYLDTPSWMKELGHVKPHVYDALPLFPSSDHRAVALFISVPSKSVRVSEDVDQTTTITEDVRVSPPFPLDPDWENKRNTARRKEIAVGYLAYVALTWHGSGLLLAMVVGGMGVWLVLRSLLVG